MPSATQALQQQIQALATDIDKSMAAGQPADLTKKTKLEALKKQLGQAALKAPGDERVKIASQADEEESEESESTQNESTQIASFLKAISQKNYAQADKYLQGVVESKIKTSISKAIQLSK
jgi:hypothetical protein